MTQSKQPKHIHQLKRHKFGSGNTIFFCKLPDCTFKIKQPLALGKESLCNRCGKPFIMNEYSIRLANPHCQDCHKSKSQIEFENSSTIKDMSDKEDVLSGELSLMDKLKQVASGQTINNTNPHEDEEI